MSTIAVSSAPKLMSNISEKPNRAFRTRDNAADASSVRPKGSPIPKRADGAISAIFSAFFGIAVSRATS